MVELLELDPANLRGDLATGVHKLLRDAFPDEGLNEGDYYRTLGAPDVAMVLLDGPKVFAHLGLYVREVAIGSEALKIGMLGGIAVAPDHRRVGHTRTLIRHAHDHMRRQRMLFSILFAYEPRIYESSGYRLMQNATRFVETDGTLRTLRYSGGMYAELSQRDWPNLLLDLRGRTV